MLRRWQIRPLVLITLIFGIALASLLVADFDLNILGVRLERHGLQLGLDLQGGTHLVYQADTPNPTETQMEGVIDNIKRRVNAFGVTEPIVQLLGEDRVLVQLPGLPGSIITATFEAPVEMDALRSTLADLGKPDASVRPEGDRGFTIQIRKLRGAERDAEGNVTQPAEKDLIQQALEEQLGALESFDVSGGAEEAKRLIGQTAQLVFKERTYNDPECPTEFCDKEVGLTGEHLARAYPDTDTTTGFPIIGFQFDSEGGRIFGDVTTRLAQSYQRAIETGGTPDQFAVFLDEEELLAPTARRPILGGSGVITRSNPPFTREQVRRISIQLESGRLPVPLKLIQERDVDATLGADSLEKSKVAAAVGLGLVMLFMVLYYRLPGLLAAVTLGLYAALVMAIFKLIPVTLTLAGIAAFILSIGMAVDANILIFERMKEELRMGRTLLAAVEAGFNRAWPSIRDSNVSTFITCAILWWFGDRLGAALVQGFAVTLFIGVAVSMFSAITVTRTFLRIVARSPLGEHLGLFVSLEPTKVPAPRGVLGERS